MPRLIEFQGITARNPEGLRTKTPTNIFVSPYAIELIAEAPEAPGNNYAFVQLTSGIAFTAPGRSVSQLRQLIEDDGEDPPKSRRVAGF